MPKALIWINMLYTLIQVYVRDKEILSVSIKISDEIVYENVYFEKGEGNTITAYVGKTKTVCLM